jgi:hypothetical protein
VFDSEESIGSNLFVEREAKDCSVVPAEQSYSLTLDRIQSFGSIHYCFEMSSKKIRPDCNANRGLVDLLIVIQNTTVDSDGLGLDSS